MPAVLLSLWRSTDLLMQEGFFHFVVGPCWKFLGLPSDSGSLFFSPAALPLFILGPQEQRQESVAPSRGLACPYSSGSASRLRDLSKTELSFSVGQTTTRPKTEAACSGGQPAEPGL